MDTEVTNEGEAFEAPDAGLTEDDFGYEDPAAEGDFSEAQTETPRSFIVKVPGGQEVEVDESELVKGYQRQADYTRKTQELAQERQALQQAEVFWNALQENPGEVIQLLQQHYGDLEDFEPPDPTEQRLREHDAFINEQRQREAEAQVNSELARLSSEYGEFDGNDLLEYAIQHEIPNLEAALLHQRRANERVRGDRERLQAKRSAPPIAGGSRAQGAHTQSDRPILSLNDALNAAKAELGWQ